jgi:hypothetical protein
MPDTVKMLCNKLELDMTQIERIADQLRQAYQMSKGNSFKRQEGIVRRAPSPRKILKLAKTVSEHQDH